MSDKTTEEAAEILCRSDFEDESGTLMLSTESGFYTTIDIWKSANLIGALYEQQVSMLSTTIAQLREENERLKDALLSIMDCTGSSTMQYHIAKDILNVKDETED